MPNFNIDIFVDFFRCNSYQQLYVILENIYKEFKPFGGDQLPFTSQELEESRSQDLAKQGLIKAVLMECWYAYETKELVPLLRKNPPKISYNNPNVISVTYSEEAFVWKFLTMYGVDVPGSRYNPIGMGYYSDIFYDIFFGNYTEFMEHIDKFSEQKLQLTLAQREGYGRFTLLFAPIIGRRLVNVDKEILFTDEMKKEYKDMYHGENENRHVDIIEKLLVLGADPNAHDRAGLTPLYHALQLFPEDRKEVMAILLKHGANPNFDTAVDKLRILMDTARLFYDKPDDYCDVIDMLMDYNAKPRHYRQYRFIRCATEVRGSLQLAVKVREGLPIQENECELSECSKYAARKCSACKHVFYCSLNCQKLDWRFHKPTCLKNRKAKDESPVE